MGLFKAIGSSVEGMLADQWKDYYVPKAGYTATTAVFPAVPVSTNNGRGENTKGSVGIISNGSKIQVPEGTALITIQDGAVSGCIMEPGGYEFRSDDPNSQSFFAGDGIWKPFVVQSWERLGFGGQPATEQLAIYVNLKGIPNNKFGTPEEIYWDDAFLGTQVAAKVKGEYEIKIIDPIAFVKKFLDTASLVDGGTFDFSDIDNELVDELFQNVVSCLGPALSRYTNDPEKKNRISNIQGDQLGFAKTLSEMVEEHYHWKTDRGLEISKVSLEPIQYDDDTKELLKDVKRADALSGARGNSFMQQAAARGFQAAGENGGAAGMAFMGMGMNAVGGAMGGLQQQVPQEEKQDPMAELAKYKQMLDAGLITQEDYDALKKKLLGV